MPVIGAPAPPALLIFPPIVVFITLEDETGAVEHLDLPGGLEIALLHRRERMVDNNEAGLFGAYQPF